MEATDSMNWCMNSSTNKVIRKEDVKILRTEIYISVVQDARSSHFFVIPFQNWFFGVKGSDRKHLETIWKDKNIFFSERWRQKQFFAVCVSITLQILDNKFLNIIYKAHKLFILIFPALLILKSEHYVQIIESCGVFHCLIAWNFDYSFGCYSLNYSN